MVEIVDDAGGRIQEELEVCLGRATSNGCSPVQQEFQLPKGDFLWARFEGPRHGPVRFDRRELEELARGSGRLAIPRKARFEVSSNSEGPLKVSLYYQSDLRFLKPVHLWEEWTQEYAYVAAADYVVVLKEEGLAPDLQLVTLASGQRYQATHRRVEGWSLLLRLIDDEGQGLGDVSTIFRRTTPPSEDAERTPTWRRESLESGLVAISGLGVDLAEADFSRRDLVDATVRGLSANPGSFAFREVELLRGGGVQALVLINGSPTPGIECEIVEREALIRTVAGQPAPTRVRKSAEADDAGVCQFLAVAPGQVLVRAHPTDESFVDEETEVEPGRVTHVELDLNRIQLHGSVLRDGEPVEGVRVVLLDVPLDRLVPATSDFAVEEMTDSEGDWESEIWRSGTYWVLAWPPGMTAPSRRERYLSSAEEEIRIELSKYELSGHVREADGTPIEGAAVLLRDGSTFRALPTDAEGGYGTELPGPVTLLLSATKQGFSDSEPTSLDVDDATPSARLDFTLEQLDEVQGRVVAPDGRAVSQATIMAFRESAEGDAETFRFGENRLLAQTASSVDGRFSFKRSSVGAARLFVSARGCPLMEARLADTPGDELVVVCDPAMQSALLLRMIDENGKPRSGRQVRLRRNGSMIPLSALRLHLNGLGLPLTTDHNGSLMLYGLQEGEYEVYSAERSSAATIRTGSSRGFLLVTRIFAGTMREFEIEEPR